jgi:hypothetical protein
MYEASRRRKAEGGVLVGEEGEVLEALEEVVGGTLVDKVLVARAEAGEVRADRGAGGQRERVGRGHVSDFQSMSISTNSGVLVGAVAVTKCGGVALRVESAVWAGI